MGEVESPRRRNQRHPMELGAVIRTPQGLSFDATMEDVSVNGCSLRLQPGHLKVDRQVLIRLDGLESLIGIVRWIDADLAGNRIRQSFACGRCGAPCQDQSEGDVQQVRVKSNTFTASLS